MDSLANDDILHWTRGEPRRSINGEFFESFDPSEGTPYCRVARGGPQDVDLAIEAAWEAFRGSWGGLDRETRAALLDELGQRITDHAESLAITETKDTGRPITIARRIDAHAPTAEMKFYAQIIRAHRDVFHAGDPSGMGLTLRQPYGVVGLIIPWNAPLIVLAEKVSQILAAGNCMVVKPSESAPASASLLAQLLTEAGLPPGVLNVVQGSGKDVGTALARHAHVPRISFTGSTPVGGSILEMGAPTLKETTLEMGGKNPVLVFEDANVDSAVANATLSAFYNTGQLCTSGSRIYVHEAIADPFVERFVQAAAALRIGNPMDSRTQLGPIITPSQLKRIRSFIDLGLAECELLYGGEVPDQLHGWYEAPHVFRVPSNDHPLMQEEIFGPVSGIMTFSDEDEALALANDTNYGLSSFVWTNDAARINRFVRGLEVGRVWVNTGHAIPPDMTLAGWKQSGVGAEGGLEGILSFTRLKSVNMRHEGPLPSFDLLFDDDNKTSG